MFWMKPKNTSATFVFFRGKAEAPDILVYRVNQDIEGFWPDTCDERRCS